MGDIAEMCIEGILCETCGVYLDGEAPGHPRRCGGCAEDSDWPEELTAKEEEEKDARRPQV